MCDTYVTNHMVLSFQKQKNKHKFRRYEKMVVGQIINCCTVDEVIRKAFELKDKGIVTEFVSNCALRVVCID